MTSEAVLSSREPSAAVGRAVADLETPALVIDLAVLDANIARMVATARQAGGRLRPHVKTHRMAAVASRLQRAGAEGICCAKVGEAEAFADAGFDDIFIANQVVGASRLIRLVELAERTRLAVGVDHAEHVRALGTAFAAADATIDVSIEIDTGQGRTGVADSESAVALAKQTLGADGLNLRGIYTHEGHDYQAAEPAGVHVAAEESQHLMTTVAQAIQDATGAPCEVSMGSSPSFLLESFHAPIDELRPGTAVFNDASHAHLLGHADWCAATVLATVVNLPAPDRVVIDAGAKALTSDRRGPGVLENTGHGMVVGHPEAVITSVSDEHGVIAAPDAGAFAIGQTLRVIPNHICPCVNLYDHAFAARDGIVEAVWHVTARGRSQ
ncbi:MAG: alanine racemase [Chloroflexi bacterium]|nr:alanine racemase [Chloroflexota bacterium]